jgi:hypothetical protein
MHNRTRWLPVCSPAEHRGDGFRVRPAGAPRNDGGGVSCPAGEGAAIAGDGKAISGPRGNGSPFHTACARDDRVALVLSPARERERRRTRHRSRLVRAAWNDGEGCRSRKDECAQASCPPQLRSVWRVCIEAKDCLQICSALRRRSGGHVRSLATRPDDRPAVIERCQIFRESNPFSLPIAGICPSR